MKEKLIALLRENSTVRGLVDMACAIFLFYVLAHLPKPPAGLQPAALEAFNTLISGFQMTIIGVAAALGGRGLLAMRADTTPAGEAIKVAKAMDTLANNPPKLPDGVSNPATTP